MRILAGFTLPRAVKSFFGPSRILRNTWAAGNVVKLRSRLEALHERWDRSPRCRARHATQPRTGARVSPSLVPMLGARTQLGRTFLEEEDQPGRDNVVLLNDKLWRSRFASDRNIVGRKILLDGQPYEVVGVLSPGFHFPRL